MSFLSPVVSAVSSGLCCLQWSPLSPVVSAVSSGLTEDVGDSWTHASSN